jgi:8-oxo-dGTP pyrophosphatase MutT (NUDIX family)
MQRLAQRSARHTASRSRALALAAIRETFEETGYLIGCKAASSQTASDGPWAEFLGHPCQPTPGALAFIARAITPPKRPRRFDTRFFAASIASVAGQVKRDIGPDAELTELVWATLDEALGLDLPVITQVIIEELRERLTSGSLNADLPVPLYYEVRRNFRRDLV